ncbi:nuclear transport factor 2 family protein [Curtobacterium sp. 1P10AnD]|uniref:nuclear transport factor 2 family protein n=1 Tax=Curtobacterium sp. 1P10AnD TaxID=3132283 RepID=UPI0039A05C31
MTNQTDHNARTPAETARDAFDRWSTMWNGDATIAREVCADDFRIRFAVTEPDGSTPADRIRTADDFTAYLECWHGQHPGAVSTAIGDALDGRHGRIIRHKEAGDVHVGGVDVFDFAEDGRVARVWSAGGQRSMRASSRCSRVRWRSSRRSRRPRRARW